MNVVADRVTKAGNMKRDTENNTRHRLISAAIKG